MDCLYVLSVLHLSVLKKKFLFVCLMVLNATFNNISVISWWSFIGGGNWRTTDLSQVTDKLYHIMLYSSPWSRFELTTSVVMSTDCIGSCKSNYHTITASMAPKKKYIFTVQNHKWCKFLLLFWKGQYILMTITRNNLVIHLEKILQV